ncbi:unnamed protein product [Ixodes hexagonus]
MKLSFVTRSLLRVFHNTRPCTRVRSYTTCQVVPACRRHLFGMWPALSRSEYSTEVDLIEFENFVQSGGYVDNQPRFGQLYLPGAGHNVLVVQPRVRKGPRFRGNTTSDLQLAEAVALLETLPEWHVAAKLQLNTENENRQLIFGKGNLARITDLIKEKANVSALFINLDVLTGIQHTALQQHFALPVYDRYTVVLNIFRHHARTKEAKLQIALAELPHYRSRIRQLHQGSRPESGQHYERQKQMLRDREQALKRQLEEIKAHRQLLRQKRTTLQFPVVAVVGYTNAGKRARRKTSLIKQLTGDQRLEPRNQLFATLDVTAHAGRLPSLQTVLYMDTVGFISDIPTSLVASFASTLEDVLLADVIVHVRDLSHPDAEAQRQNVMETLARINVPTSLLESIIEVGNKIDLLPCLPEDEAANLVSCVDGTGVQQLRHTIERQLIENTGRTVIRLRVPTGGSEYRWLFKEGTFQTCSVDEQDTNYSFIDAVLTPVALAKFRHHFGSASILN